MLCHLQENPQQILNPPQGNLMPKFCDAWASLEIDTPNTLKSNFVLNALDSSEDYLVSEKLYELVGAKMVEFRKNLVKSTPPSSLQE